MKRIVYTRPDGGVSVVTPVICRDDPPGFTEDDAVARALARSIPADATEIEIVDATEIPTDRTFRDAWRKTGKAVAVDMPKARAIHMDRIRRVRDAELAKLDLDYMRADERGDATEKGKIAVKKQALRDLPQTFDLTAAQTPEELKALWPAGLPRGGA